MPPVDSRGQEWTVSSDGWCTGISARQTASKILLSRAGVGRRPWLIDTLPDLWRLLGIFPCH